MTHNSMDLRALEERRRDLIREAEAERRSLRIREAVRTAAASANPNSLRLTLAGTAAVRPLRSRFCCRTGRLLMAAGRGLLSAGERLMQEKPRKQPGLSL